MGNYSTPLRSHKETESMKNSVYLHNKGTWY